MAEVCGGYPADTRCMRARASHANMSCACACACAIACKERRRANLHGDGVAHVNGEGLHLILASALRPARRAVRGGGTPQSARAAACKQGVAQHGPAAAEPPVASEAGTLAQSHAHLRCVTTMSLTRWGLVALPVRRCATCTAGRTWMGHASRCCHAWGNRRRSMPRCGGLGTTAKKPKQAGPVAYHSPNMS